MPSWTRLDWIALAAVTIGAGLVRLAGLNRPIGLVFDEIFYARDACLYVLGTEAVCGVADLQSRAHPPLGKWLIGSGIGILGHEPVGWRIMAAIAGTLTVALCFVLGRRLLAPGLGARAATVGAFAAAGLLATDLLHVVQSRVAMLDVFIVLFVVAAVTAIVIDRDRDWETARDDLIGRLTLGRPWRLVAGACLGAASATKWSGAYVGLGLIGLVIAWEVAASSRRLAGTNWRAAWWDALRREALPSILLLGLVPVAVYLLTYTGRMPGAVLAAPWEPGSVWRGIWDHQRAMLDFHTGLGGHHPYESPPWSWPFLKRPVAYYFAAQDGAYREILALGNPLVWWPGLLAVIATGAAWLRRGADSWRPEAVILAAALATWGPWLVLSGSRDQTFLWYLLPTIPFLCLALGLVAGAAWRHLAGRVATVGYALLVVASFGFYFPLLTALPVEPDAWRLRILFADCERPGAPTLRLPDDEINSGSPPTGWCWI